MLIDVTSEDRAYVASMPMSTELIELHKAAQQIVDSITPPPIAPTLSTSSLAGNIVTGKEAPRTGGDGANKVSIQEREGEELLRQREINTVHDHITPSNYPNTLSRLFTVQLLNPTTLPSPFFHSSLH